MTLHELMIMMNGWFDEASIGEDDDGQVVIYTGLKVVDSYRGEEILVPFDVPEHHKYHHHHKHHEDPCEST